MMSDPREMGRNIRVGMGRQPRLPGAASVFRILNSFTVDLTS